MATIQQFESAIISEIRGLFPDELYTEACGDADTVLKFMLSRQVKMGLIIEYFGSQRSRMPPFDKYMWGDDFTCIVVLSVNLDTVEEDTKNIVNSLKTAFKTNRRLGTLADLVTVERIERPRQNSVNEVPLQWIPFLVSIYNKES